MFFFAFEVCGVIMLSFKGLQKKKKLKDASDTGKEFKQVTIRFEQNHFTIGKMIQKRLRF